MIDYAPLQRKWLRFHFEKWTREFGWSPAEFATRVRQPVDALALALGLPLDTFEPPPQIAAPTPDLGQLDPATYEPMALPDPDTASVIIEPGIELMPREKPPVAAPPPKPYRRRAVVMLKPGPHTVNGVAVYIHPPADNPGATLVEYEVTPDARHIIDGKNAVVQTTSMFQIHA